MPRVMDDAPLNKASNAKDIVVRVCWRWLYGMRHDCHSNVCVWVKLLVSLVSKEVWVYELQVGHGFGFFVMISFDYCCLFLFFTKSLNFLLCHYLLWMDSRWYHELVLLVKMIWTFWNWYFDLAYHDVRWATCVLQHDWGVWLTQLRLGPDQGYIIKQRIWHSSSVESSAYVPSTTMLGNHGDKKIRKLSALNM